VTTVAVTGHKMMEMKAQQKTILIAVATAAATSVLCTLLIRTIWPEPEWKASGDRRTIFNTRTGEVRYAASGRSVAEVQAELERERKESEERRERERLADARERERVHSHNSAIFRKLKQFVDAHPDIVVSGYGPSVWESRTRPFRINKLLSRRQHYDLLNYLAKAVNEEPYKSDPDFIQAIEDLNEWDLTYDY
jgi:hypothetical protein